MATAVTLTAAIGYGGSLPVTTVGWTQISGPGTATITSPLELSTAVSIPTTGDPDVYVFQYEVIKDGVSHTDTVQVTVKTNTGPTVDTGGPYADTFPGTTFPLTGVYTDADGLPAAGPVVTTWSIARTVPAFPDTFRHYDKAIPDNPGSTQTDFTFFVDLSALSTAWWAAVKSDGGDIRVSTGANVQLPVDVIEFDAVAKTGFLAFRATKLSTNEEFRIWVGDPDATTDAVGDPFGQHNAYASHVIAFWPDGGGLDHTSSGFDLGVFGSPSPVAGDVAGPIGGSRGTAYVAANSQRYRRSGATGITGADPFTMIGWGWTAVTASDQTLLATGGAGTDGASTLGMNTSQKTEFNREGGGAGSVASVASYPTSTWFQTAAVFTSTVDYNVFLNGVVANETTAIQGAVNPTTLNIGGTEFDLDFLDGRASLVSLHDNTALSDNWVAYHHTMGDQTVFWNGWTSVPEPTTTIADASDLTTDLTMHKTGTFTLTLLGDDGELNDTDTDTPIVVNPSDDIGDGYDSTTPDNPGSELTDHTFFIDMSELSTTW